jgi:hypothetical protein
MKTKALDFRRSRRSRKKAVARWIASASILPLMMAGMLEVAAAGGSGRRTSPRCRPEWTTTVWMPIAAGALDAQRDLAAVRDQDLLEH